MEFQEIVAEVGFNYDKDAEEFGKEDRIVSLNRFTDEEGQDVIGISFNLGRKEDDTFNLILPSGEFIQKLFSLEREP
jgi:hypothetical protein